MVGSRLLFRVAAVAVLLALATPAFSAEVVRLKDGGLLPGDVVSVNDKSVLLARESGGEVRIPWTAVLPVSRYELVAATLEPSDRAGRVALAEWGVGAGLFVQSRRSLLEAKGLLPAVVAEGGTEGGQAGAPAQRDEAQRDEAKRIDALLDDVATSEADRALSEIDEALAGGKPENALVRARRYLRVAPPGDHADRVRARVPDLLVRIEQKEEFEKESAKDKAAERRQIAKQKKVDQYLKRAVTQKTTASEKQAAAYNWLAKGNQTRSRRSLNAAEKGFTDARKGFAKSAKLAGPGETFEYCKNEARDCDRRVLDLLKRWARLEVDNKAWKRANAVVDRAMRIDAVDTELLDMRREIDENWIRRKLSRITNATGHESN